MTGIRGGDKWFRARVWDRVVLGGEGWGRTGQVAAVTEAWPSHRWKEWRVGPVWPEPQWVQSRCGLLADSLAKSPTEYRGWISS